jgi:MFS family permease
VGAAFISTLAWLSLLYLPWAPGWSAYLVFAFLGFSASGFVVGYAAVKEVCVPTSAGMAVALVNTGVFLGAAIMQPLFGWIIDQTWNGVMDGAVRIYAWADYANALWASVIFAAFALLVSFKVRETNCKNITHD